MSSPMVIQRPSASVSKAPKPQRFVKDLKKTSYDDLRQMADRLGIRPKATGEHGDVIKSDLIAALRTN